jgi:HlyD family secretion protein
VRGPNHLYLRAFGREWLSLQEAIFLVVSGTAVARSPIVKTKKVASITIPAVLLAAAFFLFRSSSFADAPTLRFATVERGDLQAVVSSTGALNAVQTVSVGTQVSGQVSELLVDFNDEVKKGQLLARIDPTILQQAVADAGANLERLKAQTNQTVRDQARNSELSSEGLIAQSAFEQGQASLEVARAAEKSAAIALSRARQNLSYTSIYAPIDGVIVERNVNPGQTVAASLSAPQLFLIANDLTKMRILALVGESDIDQISDGQDVKFSVQALPNQTFMGKVEQVRLQSTTVDNVVSYTVVVAVDNPEKKLLPGMTARVDFLVNTVQGVLKVPNAALRFKPSEEVIDRIGLVAAPSPSPRAERATGEDSPTASEPGRGEGRRRRSEASGSSASLSGSEATSSRGDRTRRNGGTLYVVAEDGKLKALRVRVGLSDGVSTEVEGRELTEGMKVVTGVVSSASTSATPVNPLGGQSQGGRRGGGGFGGPGF